MFSATTSKGNFSGPEKSTSKGPRRWKKKHPTIFVVSQIEVRFIVFSTENIGKKTSKYCND